MERSPRLPLFLIKLAPRYSRKKGTKGRIRKIIGKDNPRVASGSRRRSREEKGAESAVSGFARVADTKDEERERSPPITRRSFNYAAPVDRARTVRRR